MGDDDEFGDLYTDVLQPLTSSFGSQARQTDASMSSQSRPVDRDVNSNDEEILHGAAVSRNSFSNSNLALRSELNASVQEKTLTETGARSERGGPDLNSDSSLVASRMGGGYLDSRDGGLAKGDGVKLPEKGAGGFNFMQEDDALNIIVEERDNKDDDLVDKDVQFTDKQENAYNAAEQNDDMVNFMGAGAVGEIGTEQMIPGLSGKSEYRAGSNFEDDWESDDSEDDLRIVLNDNHGQMGMERMPAVDDEDDGDDEEGEPLVIVADNGDLSHHPMMMENPEWGGEEGASGVDGERKELGDAAKASGGGGSNAAPTAVHPKIGYSNHMYHHPFHSQFKYVRPGAAPIPGPAPLAGRGRGDWRPSGVKVSVPIQKGPHPGYGIPAWGPNTAGRGYGSGLDFTLPSHKTIFEVDIGSFDEKPWRLSSIDISDFFNFGLNEESWKGYCKQLEQLRLEKTMQSKIRVYESGRAEQDYDPDLPPELAAAAVGIQDIPSENANPGKADAGASDLGKGTGRGRPPVPIGRPIPVEMGSGERLPSIDTRRPRLPDSDSVIVVVCQSSADDDNMAEQQDSDQAEEDVIDDIQQDDQDLSRRISREYAAQKRDHAASRGQLNNTINHDKVGRHDDLYAVSEAPVKYHPDRKTGLLCEERFAKGRGYAKLSKRSTSANSGENQIIDDQNESLDSEKNTRQSSSSPIGSDGEQVVAVVDNVNDISGMGDRNFDLEKDDVALDATNCDSREDAPSMHAANKRKRILHAEQVSLENGDKEDSKAGRSSDNSDATGSCKERKSYEAEDEVHQDRYHPRAGNSKRTPVGEEDNSHRRNHHGRDEIRKHMTVKEREDHHSHRGGDPNSSLHRHMKSESTEWKKESDVSEGSWRWRDEDLHGRRMRVEETRKREHGGEISSRNRGKDRGSERVEREKYHQSRSQLDNDRLRGSNHDQGTGSKQRGRGDNLITQNEKLDDLHNKRRREGAHIDREHAEKEEIAYDHRERSSRWKRDRGDSSGQRKTDDYAKLKDDTCYVRQIEEQLLQRERGERHRDHDEWCRHKQLHEEILPRRERGETRPVVRNERPVEDKPWASQSQGNDDYRGSGREYHPKDVGRHSDHLKRRNQVENESFPEHKGREDVFGRSNQDSTGEKRARYERIGSSDERVAYASDTSRTHERRQEKVSRQSRESDSQDPSSLISSKRNQDGYSGQISETVNPRGQNDTRVNLTSSRKHTDDASSDDEQSESRRGRSRPEHWTSHKERNFGVLSSLKKGKEFTGPSMKPEEPPVKLEGNQQPRPVNKDTGGETDSANMKVVDNKHLDTMEKLKIRSERFKLPMPIEKEAMLIKKIESGPLPSAQAEIQSDLEIKSERPVRKRRWTGS